MKTFSCDTCDNSVIAAEMPDDWNIVRDPNSDESLVTCAECEEKMDRVMEEMRKEYIAAGSPCHKHDMNAQGHCNSCGFGMKGRDLPYFN